MKVKALIKCFLLWRILILSMKINESIKSWKETLEKLSKE